jgi:hypothetical protein
MSLVQLTLAAPRQLEDELVEQLLAHPDWARGFTLFNAEGYSTHLEKLSAQEMVRGRAARCELQVVLEEENADALLKYLQQRLPKGDVAYWITPVIKFGRLA